MTLKITPTTETEEPRAPAPELEEGVDVRTYQVRLPLRFAEWLDRRARLFGHTPEGHVEAILREFKAQYDTSSAAITRNTPPEVGEMALTFRPR